MIPVLDKNDVRQITIALSPEQAEYVAGISSIRQEIKNDNPELDEITSDKLSEDVIFITKIMAFADKFKNLHWSANSMDYHKALDDFGEELEEYKDDIAENIQSVIGQFSSNEITKLELPVGEDPLEIIDELKNCIVDWMELHMDNMEYEGCRNASSDFLEIVHKYIYLFRLCKINKD